MEGQHEHDQDEERVEDEEEEHRLVPQLFETIGNLLLKSDSARSSYIDIANASN